MEGTKTEGASHLLRHLAGKKKKKNHYIFSSQLRADQMPGPPREVHVTMPRMPAHHFTFVIAGLKLRFCC